MCVLPLELENPVITVQLELELIKATPDDLKEIDYYKKVINGPDKKVMRIRKNLPFFLVNSSGYIDPHIYILNDDWHPAILKEYLDNEQIYIHKKFDRR